MIFTIPTCPRPHLIKWVERRSPASAAALRIAAGSVILLTALLMQSCAIEEMNSAEKALVLSSNAAEGRSAQLDSADEVADSTPERFSFGDMYRNRNKTASDEQE